MNSDNKLMVTSKCNLTDVIVIIFLYYSEAQYYDYGGQSARDTYDEYAGTFNLLSLNVCLDVALVGRQ